LIDLGAEKLVVAEKDGEKIAVEIKSFLGPSVISDFHVALGQFLNYRLALEAQGSARKLYLAVPEETYTTFFHLSSSICTTCGGTASPDAHCV